MLLYQRGTFIILTSHHDEAATALRVVLAIMWPRSSKPWIFIKRYHGEKDIDAPTVVKNINGPIFDEGSVR